MKLFKTFAVKDIEGALEGCKTTQLALAWVVSQGLIPIAGTTKAHRLEENWGSRRVELTEEEVEEMRKIIELAKPEGVRYGAANQAMVGHVNPSDNVSRQVG